ncbi:MAG: pyridine nucleotide-disulfide oxidoreductase, partial [Ruthenibacterium sp.]
DAACDKTVLFFRSKDERSASVLSLCADGKEIFTKKYRSLRPPEMERITVDFKTADLNENSRITLSLKGGK